MEHRNGFRNFGWKDSGKLEIFSEGELVIFRSWLLVADNWRLATGG